MAQHRDQRRLAAIFCADVVGYSRLMGVDEAGTLAQLKVHRKEIIDPKIAEHQGRIVKTTGDGMLVEFASVVDAVHCGVEVQQAMARRNADVAEERRIELRVGINLGDIIADGDDIYGDGVNIAARLEGLAEPGGICISGKVFEEVKHKLSVGFEDIGPQEVKNIAEPVPAYRIVPGPVSVAAGAKAAAKPSWASHWRLPAIAAAVIVVVAVGATALWQTVFRPAPAPQVASGGKPSLVLPTRPSIAVLPFANMSEDPKQEYFADGMTDDLITDLSKISGLFVIARNSVFTYKGRAVKAQQVAKELGVRYVLEGSVRRAEGKVRINAQLVDASTGRHLWAERYDRDYKEIFALQDEVIGKIVSALAVELTDTEQARRAVREETDNLQAYDHLLRGRQYLSRFTSADTAKAKEMFEKAIALDPNYARAYTTLGRLHYDDWRIWGKSRDKNLTRALELGQKAVALDDTLADAHLLIAQVYQSRREHEQAEVEIEKVLALRPTDAETVANLGGYLRWSGRAQEATGLLQKAMRLDPFFPAWYLNWLGHAYFLTGRYEQAIRTLKQGIERNSYYTAFHVHLAASYALAGREAEARAAAAEILKLNPDFSLQTYEAHVPYSNRADMERNLMALRKAGLPDKSRSTAR